MNYKLPEREIEIGKRLRQFREILKIPRTVFALEIGISGERMASYEGGRVRVPYQVAKAIGERFGLNLRWLADASGPPNAFIDIEPELKMMVPGRMPFSEAYPRFLKAELEGIQEFLDMPRSEYDFVRGVTPADELRKKIAYLVAVDVRRLPRHLLGSFLTEYERMNRAFQERHAPDQEQNSPPSIERMLQIDKLVPEAQGWPPSGSEKKELTEYYGGRNVEGVKSPLKILLDRVALATRARGTKVALAKLLKVPASRVSEWLHGAGEPSGEITLRLLDWLTREEGKQEKNRGSAETPPRRKTRSTHSTYEKSKTSPPSG